MMNRKALLTLAVGAVAICLLGTDDCCGEGEGTAACKAKNAEYAAKQEAKDAAKIWKRLENEGVGPFVHITRNPIELADGTLVHCVEADGLWCREAGQGTPQTAVPKTQAQDLDPHKITSPLGLDFGG